MQYAQNAIAQTTADRSRIEADIETVKKMTESVESTMHRIMRHARSLGYFEAAGKPEAAAPTPVITTMADALNALSRAVNDCSGSLNVFD